MAFTEAQIAQAQIDLTTKQLLADLLAYIDSAQTLGADVTASAAELNVLDGVTAGTTSASLALVVGVRKQLDVLRVALQSFDSAGIENSITAHAGGTQAAALALSASKSVHRVTVVGTAADSVKLPAATGSGDMHIVANDDSAESLQLFGAGTDTIDGVATATGVAVAAGKRRICIDFASGTWLSILSA